MKECDKRKSRISSKLQRILNKRTMKTSEKKGKNFEEIHEILLCHYGSHLCANFQFFNVLSLTSTLVDIV